MVGAMAPLDPADIDIATLAWLAGSSANRAILAELHKTGHAGVRNSHGYVVQHLIDGAPTVSELADLLGVTQQAASKHLLELERLGYVARVPDPVDSRVRRARLTDHGRRLVDDSRRIRQQLDDRLTRVAGNDAADAARRVLIRLLDTTGETASVIARRAALPSE
jgi:DNA-binding MarR family transcriptional regulator